MNFFNVDPKRRLVLKQDKNLFLKINNNLHSNALDLCTSKPATGLLSVGVTLLQSLDDLEVFESPFHLRFNKIKEDDYYIFQYDDLFYMKIHNYSSFNCVNLNSPRYGVFSLNPLVKIICSLKDLLIQ
jgi:hypothetical protein